ncbi:YebC/PmpR family DNA-binding transcriptional regulator [Candidatus Uhrbacteria bacterium]|nr:YebC/PmpR family DNA-binding transcriptional regulator [Candidatus Uhrbacteria bacterium]
MSKHSKWAKIKRKKEVTDNKKGAAFTKLTNNITIAVKEGGGPDPDSNFKLRLTIDAARAQNVPKENIERAIQRGAGKAGGAALEQLLFEGYGPEKIAVMVEATTDSRNRTVSEVKHLFTAGGGTMGGTGSVAWQFEKKGVIRISNFPALPAGRQFPISNDIELALIDAGADDIRTDDDIITILTAPEHLQHLKEAVERLDLTIDEFNLEWIAKETIAISDPAAQERVAEFLQSLEEHDDVIAVFTNAALE